jgi:hypothetical protein
MAFDWNNFLTLAEQLAQDNDEASQRTAIGRAYYAIFNVACERAIQNCGQPVGPKHAWCWTQYRRNPNRRCRQIGLEGDRLKKLRNKADYESAAIPRLNETVTDTLTEAAQFQEDFLALPQHFPTP